MPRPKSVFPTYRKHKQSGQAIVTIPIPGTGRKDITLGRYGSAESKAEYRRLCATLDANDGQFPTRGDGLTVNEVLLPFIRHVDEYHRRLDGSTTHETVEYRLTLRTVKELFGHTPAAEFGPLALKAVRDSMVKAGLCRTLINRRIGRVKRAFKWAASEELVPPSVFHGLTTVVGLQRGRTDAPEHEIIKPVDESTVSATLPFLSRHVAGLVRFQLLTGCRPGEACTLRRADLDTSAAVWLYRPAVHKLSYRGKSRVIAVGPKSQAVLSEFPTHNIEDYVFSPARSVAEIHSARSANRVTPRFPSHMDRNVKKRKIKPATSPSSFYETSAYGQAVAKGVKRANDHRAKMAGGENFDSVSHWHPNQLRHTHGTKVRTLYGLEAAQVALGHERADVTQVYAERNLSLAVEVADAVG